MPWINIRNRIELGGNWTTVLALWFCWIRSAEPEVWCFPVGPLCTPPPFPTRPQPLRQGTETPEKEGKRCPQINPHVLDTSFPPLYAAFGFPFTRRTKHQHCAHMGYTSLLQIVKARSSMNHALRREHKCSNNQLKRQSRAANEGGSGSTCCLWARSSWLMWVAISITFRGIYKHRADSTQAACALSHTRSGPYLRSVPKRK